MERKIIPLWPEGIVPFADKSPDQPAPTLTAYEVAGAETAMVVCPGGGYEFKADHEGGPVAERFTREGIACYVLDYRVHPCFYLAPLADAQRAIRLVRAMGYKKVGILGFSAGGNLCCSAATHWDLGNPNFTEPVEHLSCRPDFFVPCYPVASFTQFTHVGSVVALLGEPDDHTWRRYFSSELNVTPETPPAFIWHTANDELVPVENSLLLAGALSKNGVKFELHVYPDGPHGMGLAEDRPDVSQWPAEAARFIKGLA